MSNYPDPYFTELRKQRDEYLNTHPQVIKLKELLSKHIKYDDEIAINLKEDIFSSSFKGNMHDSRPIEWLDRNKIKYSLNDYGTLIIYFHNIL